MPAQLKPTGGLEGCGVLVTGGGTGIGAACARVAAADGAAVTICGRTEASLEASVEKIAPVVGHGGSIRHVVGDVTDEDDVIRIVAAAVEATGTLDGVVANAGGGGSLAPLGMQDVDEFERVMRLNATGTFLTAKHSLPHLDRVQGLVRGHVVVRRRVHAPLLHRLHRGEGCARADRAQRGRRVRHPRRALQRGAARLHHHRDHGRHLA